MLEKEPENLEIIKVVEDYFLEIDYSISTDVTIANEHV